MSSHEMTNHEMSSHEMTNHEMTSHEMTSHEMIGIDIAARELAVIGERVTLEPTYENTPAGRQALVKALRRSKRPVRVVMEATGIYFLDVACDLADAGFEVMVVNPRVAHHFAEAILQRRKDDPTDAAMLQEYGRRMTFVPWVPPRAEVLALRALTREVQAQTKATAAAKNRLHALRATRLTPASLLRALERQIARAEALIDELMTAAVALVEADPELAQRFGRIDGIPGFGAKATVTVMGELVTLPRMSARQWVAQAGLDVREERSGTSVQRRSKISKRGNKRLREALFYPALTAGRCCPEAHAFVTRLIARGKTPLQAEVALMRKLLHAIHALWHNNEAFDAKKLFAQV